MASSSTDDDQQVNRRGPRDRGASRGGGNGAEPRGGTSGEDRGGNGTAGRPAERRGDPGQRTTASRGGDREAEPQRTAVQRGRDRDHNQTSGRRDNGPVVVTRNRPTTNVYIGSAHRAPRFYAPAHYDLWARQYYRWSPIGYAPWSLIYGSIGYASLGLFGGVGSPNPWYGNYGYGYGSYGPGPYSPWQASGYDIGGIRLKIRPRDAQVFVDGYYAGLVDDFDGTFQSLRLEHGGHKIEIRMPGFEDLELDVHVQAGRTITLNENLRPRP